MTKKAIINKEFCKGCGMCVAVCPVNALVIGETFNKSGTKIAELRDEEKCIGCGRCFMICPDFAIEVK